MSPARLHQRQKSQNALRVYRQAHRLAADDKTEAAEQADSRWYPARAWHR
jgi:serine kinase of HPr protein (carbohydrate metabolism regulator)